MERAKLRDNTIARCYRLQKGAQIAYEIMQMTRRGKFRKRMVTISWNVVRNVRVQGVEFESGAAGESKLRISYTCSGMGETIVLVIRTIKNTQ